MTLGCVHSIESMGLVDGPGIRTVIFLQGCRLRCKYCHNPDTWAEKASENMILSPEDLLKRILRFKPYFGSDGGVTFSGGEPLLQSEFLCEILTMCKDAGIHTCIDTAGCGRGDYEHILSHTDLLIYDIKHYTQDGYLKITGCSDDETKRFLETAQNMAVPLWIRHVVVPGLTDGDEHLSGLESYLETLTHIQKVELLPYHPLGVHKYHEMHMKYPLDKIPPLSHEKIAEWNKRLNRNLTANVI